MNYNELSKKAHQAAVSGGWYTKQRDSNELLILILSEMYEAFEAWRKQKYCTMLSEDYKILTEASKQPNKEHFKHYFKVVVKDTFEDECSDVVIRVLDMAGYYDIEIPEVKQLSLLKDGITITKQFTLIVTGMLDETMTGEKIAILLGFMEEVASLFDFDLEKHINLKMSYNATRGVRHGGKIA